jgi:hypothetical protein
LFGPDNEQYVKTPARSRYPVPGSPLVAATRYILLGEIFTSVLGKQNCLADRYLTLLNFSDWLVLLWVICSCLLGLQELSWFCLLASVHDELLLAEFLQTADLCLNPCSNFHHLVCQARSSIMLQRIEFYSSILWLLLGFVDLGRL